MDNLIFDMSQEIDDEQLLNLFLNNTQEIVDVDFEVEPVAGPSKEKAKEKETVKEDKEGTLLIEVNARSFYEFFLQYVELVIDRAAFKKGFFNVEVNEKLIERRNILTKWKSSLIEVPILYILQQGQDYKNMHVHQSILLHGIAGMVNTLELREGKYMKYSMRDAIWDAITILLYWCHVTLQEHQYKQIDLSLTGILLIIFSNNY